MNDHHRQSHIFSSILYMALLGFAPRAVSAPIPDDVTIDCVFSYDEGFSYSDPGSSHAGTMKLTAAGAATITTVQDGSLLTGSNAMAAAFTDIGDGAFVSPFFAYATGPARTQAGFDAHMMLSNASPAETYVVRLSVVWDNSADASGSNAFVHSEFTLDEGVKEVHSSDIESDTKWGDMDNGIPLSSPGGVIGDSGSSILVVILQPSSTRVLNGELTAKLESLDLASACNSSFGGSISVSGVSAGSDDTDGDGATDFEEAVAGTNIEDPSDVLRITKIQGNGTSVEVTWPSKSDRLYSVQSTTNLATTPWTYHASGIPGNGTYTSYTNSGSERARFFKVGVEPLP